MTTRIARISGLLAALLVLAGCTVGPDYQKPAAATPAQYKEAAPVLAAHETGNWKPAQPSEEALRGECGKSSATPG